MKIIIFSAISLMFLCSCPEARADEVCLKNGNSIEGIVVEDSDNILELEVFLNAKITFTKQDIAYVKRWDEQNNQSLKDKWLQEKKEREKAELARQEFEAKQRARGLVKYRDQWIPQQEKERLEIREYINEVLRQKTERGEILRFKKRKRTNIARSLLARGSWSYRQTENFVVYYEDVIQSKIVADRAEYYYEKIVYDLNYEKTIRWPHKCEVFIIPTEEKWQDYMQEFIDRFDHVGGFVPRTGEKEIYLCSLSLPYLSVTFPHELTHLIFREFAQGKYIPLWLNEGLAIYESGLIGYADELLRDKVKKAEHIPIQEMVEMRDYPQTREGMELFYAQAEKTVEFLITQHGRKDFSQFCQLLISGYTFAKALDSVYGNKYYSQNKFQRAWVKYVLR